MPTLTLSAANGAAFLTALVPKLQKAVMEAERQNIALAESELVRASSGTHSTADLKKAGHPYSRRAPNSAYDPATINAQTGHFKSGWHKQNPVAITGSDGGDTVIVSRVVNTDPKAAFMDGTDNMVKRPIVELTEARIVERRNARLARACDKAYKESERTK